MLLIAALHLVPQHQAVQVVACRQHRGPGAQLRMPDCVVDVGVALEHAPVLLQDAQADLT